MDAGQMAGLEVLDIINEPTAAAIAFGYQLGFLDRDGPAAGDEPLRVLVYDLGGGTFDVTIVEIQGNAFKALATDGDVALGGKDWDEQLVDLAAEQFIAAAPRGPATEPASLQELWLAAEDAKKTLTERPQGDHVRQPPRHAHQGRGHAASEFEERDRRRCSAGRSTTTEIVVRQAGLTWAEIDRVLLVGGSTRMPMVGAMLEELTGKAPDRSVSADEAVAHGAALYADLLLQAAAPQAAAAGSSRSPTSTRTAWASSASTRRRAGKRNQILIPKNTPLPHTVTEDRSRRTSRASRACVIRVVEGESERPEACIQVGVCTIDDLPPDLPAGSPVQVSYAYEENGQLEVTAQVQGAQTIRHRLQAR